MVTVKDLIEKLEELDQDMPVYWGIGELPCWMLKVDATIEDFPMKIDYYRGKCGLPQYFLYIDDADFYCERINSLERTVRDLRQQLTKRANNKRFFSRFRNSS